MNIIFCVLNFHKFKCKFIYQAQDKNGQPWGLRSYECQRCQKKIFERFGLYSDTKSYFELFITESEFSFHLLTYLPKLVAGGHNET